MQICSEKSNRGREQRWRWLQWQNKGRILLKDTHISVGWLDSAKKLLRNDMRGWNIVDILPAEFESPARFLLRSALLCLGAALTFISSLKEAPVLEKTPHMDLDICCSPLPHQPDLSYCWSFTFTAFRYRPILHPTLQWTTGSITIIRPYLKALI